MGGLSSAFPDKMLFVRPGHSGRFAKDRKRKKESVAKLKLRKRSPTAEGCEGRAESGLCVDGAPSVSVSEDLVQGRYGGEDSVVRLDPNEAYREHLLDIIRDVAVQRPAYTVLLDASEKELALLVLNGLTLEEQNVISRLQLRKGPWFRASEVSKYLSDPSLGAQVVSSLESKGIFERPSSRDTVLEAVEALFTVAEQKQLLLKLGGRRRQSSKQRLFEAIKVLACKQKTLFGSPLDILSAVNSVAKTAKGPIAIRLRPELTHLLDRCTALHYMFDLHRFAIGYAGCYKPANTGLMVKFKKIQYPAYRCDPKVSIFSSRLHLIQLERAMQLYVRMEEILMDNQEAHTDDDIETARMPDLPCITCGSQTSTDRLVQLLDETPNRNAITITRIASSYLATLLNELDSPPQLPSFLTRFRAESVLCKVMFHGVGILEQRRAYDEAVQHLRTLLSQTYFCHGSRGKWWNRLSINLKHLNKKEEAATVCKEAMDDPLLHTENGYYIEAKNRLSNLDTSHVAGGRCEEKTREYKTEFVEGRAVNCAVGAKSKFVSGCDEGVATCSVEALALEHWSSEENGSWTGLHCESKPFRCLFTLLLWDVIFVDTVPNVFLTPYQRGPLDLVSGGATFAENRRELVDVTLKRIGEMSTSQLILAVQSQWEQRKGRLVIGVDWEGQSCHTLECVAACLGPTGVVSVLKQMCKDYNHFSSGMPDLMLCRILEKETNKVMPIESIFPNFGQRFSDDQDIEVAVVETQNLDMLSFQSMLVEVKGPNDRLAPKQHLWLQSLVHDGVDARLCKVDMAKENLSNCSRKRCKSEQTHEMNDDQVFIDLT